MLAADGFEMVRQALPQEVVRQLRDEAGRLAALEPDAAHGIRDLLRKSRLVCEVLAMPWASKLVPAGFACVRGILFDKTPGSNWLVAWHQDLTICVRERHEIADYGPWSVKHGVPHVQPPVALLEGMVSLRLHLDDAGGDNGALRVVPGSHLFGKLSAVEIEARRQAGSEVVCAALAGDAMLMKPLLLHASAKAETPAHRRVVHLEFALREALAKSLEWYE